MVKIKHEIYNFFFLSLLGFWLASCGNYLERKGMDELPREGLSLEQIDFAQVQTEIFQPRCVSCHQQYSSYSGVIRELDAIVTSVQLDRMPKTGGPLSRIQKQVLASWVAMGAPEISGDSADLDPVLLEPIWSSVFENIITPHCLVCHNPQGQAGFLDLSTRLAIFSMRDHIFGGGKTFLNFDSPEDSYLIEIVLDDVEPMPPIWSNIRRLNESEIRVLTDWIALGLP